MPCYYWCMRVFYVFGYRFQMFWIPVYKYFLPLYGLPFHFFGSRALFLTLKTLHIKWKYTISLMHWSISLKIKTNKQIKQTTEASTEAFLFPSRRHGMLWLMFFFSPTDRQVLCLPSLQNKNKNTMIISYLSTPFS